MDFTLRASFDDELQPFVPSVVHGGKSLYLGEGQCLCPEGWALDGFSTLGTATNSGVSGCCSAWKVPAGAGGWERLRDLLDSGRGKKCGITHVGREAQQRDNACGRQHLPLPGKLTCFMAPSCTFQLFL